jgi:hypothetical protein
MDGAMHTIIMAFLFQTFDIKIFNANDIETIDIHPRELMQEIISLAIDSLMQLGNLTLDHLDYDGFDAAFDLSIYLDPHISDFGEMQYAVILIDFEAGLIVIQGVVPAISFETDMTDLSTILLGRCKSLEIRPKSIIHHLKNFGIDEIQLRILKLQRWNHVLSIIGLELDAFLFSIIQIFEKPIIEPSASIQILC